MCVCTVLSGVCSGLSSKDDHTALSDAENNICVIIFLRRGAVYRRLVYVSAFYLNLDRWVGPVQIKASFHVGHGHDELLPFMLSFVKCNHKGLHKLLQPLPHRIQLEEIHILWPVMSWLAEPNWGQKCLFTFSSRYERCREPVSKTQEERKRYTMQYLLKNSSHFDLATP